MRVVDGVVGVGWKGGLIVTVKQGGGGVVLHLRAWQAAL